MKVNVAAQILNLDGTPAMQVKLNAVGRPVVGDDGEPELVPITLRDVATKVLIETLKGDDALTAQAKLSHYVVAMKLRDADEVNLTLDEMKLIRDRVGIGYGPLVVGRVNELLDPPQKASARR